MSDKVCFCNVKNKPHCCVTECRDSGWELGCYPCHTKRGSERCLQTGELPKDKSAQSRRL